MSAPFESSVLVTRHDTPPPFDLLGGLPQRGLSKGDTLYRVGDPADTAYRVEEGLLKLSIDLLTGKERIVGVVGPGDFIGALIPDRGLFQETAVVLGPQATVRVIPHSEVHHELKDELYAAAGSLVSRLRESLEDSELPVTARLARTLLRLGNRFGQVTEEEAVRLTLPLTQDNLAAMIGAARETTTAILSEMRSSGLLTGTRGRYTFDPRVLNSYAIEAAFS
ncbi:MAG: Crp/Fnr family transcriptional regulator [Trueperaceae bacterium]|nr:MAG: Crp/Fnr family transcriptional regulator [Trueperaceae bacterium]